jgi:cellulose synthase/poly-beta-1,6-N-acetylglucosamine synthase-like glycosyltransferase
MSAAELLFWGCLGLTAYTYFGYPLVLALWSGFKRPDPGAAIPTGVDPGRPRVSLIIPAYNEAASIGSTLDELRQVRPDLAGLYRSQPAHAALAQPCRPG